MNIMRFEDLDSYLEMSLAIEYEGNNQENYDKYIKLNFFWWILWS